MPYFLSFIYLSLSLHLHLYLSSSISVFPSFSLQCLPTNVILEWTLVKTYDRETTGIATDSSGTVVIATNPPNWSVLWGTHLCLYNTPTLAGIPQYHWALVPAHETGSTEGLLCTFKALDFSLQSFPLWLTGHTSPLLPFPFAHVVLWGQVEGVLQTRTRPWSAALF